MFERLVAFLAPSLVCAVAIALVPPAEAQIGTDVNAASFQYTSLAPGTIVTIVGGGLTATTAAVTDPSHPPTTLGGTTVTIGGTAAGLFYVSPTQINAVVPASLAA